MSELSLENAQSNEPVKLKKDGTPAKKRGRKPGQKNKPKTLDLGLDESQNILDQEGNNKSFEFDLKPKEDPTNEVDNILDKYKNADVVKETIDDKPLTEGQPNTTAYIKGYMLLGAINLAVPNLMSMLGKKFLKKEIDSDQIKMSEQELKDLERLADDVALIIAQKSNVSPVQALTFQMGIMYTINFMGALK